MKILFLRPSLGGERANDAMEPLVFAILRRLTPPEDETVLRDEQVETIDPEEDTDLVAITVETMAARRAYQLAALFRRRGIPVVMGGHHPTLLPDEVLRHADAVVVGDAELVWAALIRDLRAGRLGRLYRGATEAAGALDVTPDRSIFAGKRYRPVGMVQYGRGCLFACEFCSVRAFYGGRLSHRPAAGVAAEIESFGRRNIFLLDDNLVADPHLAEELFRAILPLRARWYCQVTLDVAANDRLLDLMAASGCAVAVVGFESFDRRNLEQMRKGANLAYGDYAAAVEAFRSRGIMVYGTFLFGYDHDTRDTLEAALEFALRARLCLANFNPLTPFPGTPLYERLQREGRLIGDPWWLDPTHRYGRAVFHPRGMAAAELEQGCFRARREFHRFASILARAGDRRANGRSLVSLGLFLAANLISRREMLRKQGLSLGLATEVGS